MLRNFKVEITIFIILSSSKLMMKIAPGRFVYAGKLLYRILLCTNKKTLLVVYYYIWSSSTSLLHVHFWMHRSSQTSRVAFRLNLCLCRMRKEAFQDGSWLSLAVQTTPAGMWLLRFTRDTWQAHSVTMQVTWPPLLLGGVRVLARRFCPCPGSSVLSATPLCM